MICAKCGANNPDASAYCGGCGSLMVPEPNALLAALPVREDMPTQRSEFDPSVAPASQMPQPTPGEVFQFGSSQPQAMPDAGVNPPPSTPGNSGEAYPAQGAAPIAPQSWPSGAYPVQEAAPMSPQSWPSGAYPAQGAMPTMPQSWPSGAYPPVAGSGSEFPAGAYPTYPAPGAPFVSGAYPATTPMPGEAYPGSGVYPGQQVSGVYPGQQVSGVYPGQQVSGVYPGQQVSGVYPGQPAWGAYPGQVPPVAPQEPSKLIKRLPLWAFLSSILLVAVVLIVLVFLTGKDWAAGAQTASIVALAVGCIILVAFGVRSALGMLARANPHRVSQIVSSLLLMLILFALGVVGFNQQVGAGIHVAQARFLEGQGKWSLAINEYQDGGQSVSSSVDIARTNDEWGEQLAGQQQYSSALDKFNTVISAYTANTAELTRAKNGAASAYYNLAEQDLAAKNFTDAVTNFNQLITNFGNAPEVQKAHADYARALWGQAQPELTSTCSSALTIYQQLSTQFGDTSEGQQAKAALALPQPVDGHFTGTVPGGANTPQVSLAQGVSAGMDTNAFYAILAKSPIVNVHSDGTFTFPSIKQGSYYLVWGVTDANGQDFYVGQQYPATVGPLCAFHFGDLSEAFPPAA